VVGGVVSRPRPPTAAKWIVSIVSVVAEQAGPCTRMPPMHLTTTEGVPARTVPVRSAFTG